MRIGVFVYNFEHTKTQQGLLNLILCDHKPVLALAANPVELKFYKSKIRTTPRDIWSHHPQDICEKMGIPYKIVAHNSDHCAALIREANLDLGVILGARILNKEIIESFNVGVLNMHPGILPQNRGLDTLKWAVMNNQPQGVTAHLIDKRIDRGRELIKKEVRVFKDDTLLDIQLRLTYTEQALMLQSIDMLKGDLEKVLSDAPQLGKGTYHSSLPPDLEKDLYSKFKLYRWWFGEEEDAKDN